MIEIKPPESKLPETPFVIDLVDTEILRCGETSNDWTRENCKVSCGLNYSEKIVEFSFKIPAAGRGTTVILMRIGIRDLGNILPSVAERMPEIGTTLSECAALAAKRNIELLAEARAELQKLGATEPLPSDKLLA